MKLELMEFFANELYACMYYPVELAHIVMEIDFSRIPFFFDFIYSYIRIKSNWFIVLIMATNLYAQTMALFKYINQQYFM